MWHCGRNSLEIESCAHYCGCGTRADHYCNTCGTYTCDYHLQVMPHPTNSHYLECEPCRTRWGPLYCYQCVVCTRWIPIRVYPASGGGWLPPLCRPSMTQCAICAHWVCGYCGNFTVGYELQAGQNMPFDRVARDCGRPCTSLAGSGNFGMPKPMLEDWSHRSSLAQ